jgi:hypothetical protein
VRELRRKFRSNFNKGKRGLRTVEMGRSGTRNDGFGNGVDVMDDSLFFFNYSILGPIIKSRHYHPPSQSLLWILLLCP